MVKQSTLRRLLLLVTLLVALVAVPVLHAQDATQTVDDTTEAGNEGVVAEESEAQEVGGEESGIEETATAANPLTALGINTGYLLGQIINFLLIFLILRFALWGPLVNMMDSRAAKIQKGLEDASAAANARRNAEAEADKVLAGARLEATRAAEEARSRGEEIARSIEAEARAEADRIRQEGRTRANEERDRQLADLRGQVAAIAMAAAERLIGQSIDPARQQALINDFFTRVPAGARNLTGPVEVVSAMPLTADEQATVAREIGAQDVTYSVDPDLLGGLVIRSQDRVIDGSVRSGLTEMSERLR